MTRIALLLVSAWVAMCVVQVSFVSTADAAKVRRKPPKQPLPQPQSGPDSDSPVESAPTPKRIEQPTPEIPYPASGLVCFYGQETDPDTKAVRCKSPEQLSPPRLVIVNSAPLAEKLGMLNQTSALPMPNGGPKTSGEGIVADSSSPFKARVARVSFENGAVGGARRSLRSRTDEMAQCVEDNGGLRADSARLKLLFFVRTDRKASGMIVASARNIPPPVVRCIRKVIQEGTVGRPSTNPVGVKVLIELKNNE